MWGGFGGDQAPSSWPPGSPLALPSPPWEHPRPENKQETTFPVTERGALHEAFCTVWVALVAVSRLSSLRVAALASAVKAYNWFVCFLCFSVKGPFQGPIKAFLKAF